MSSFEEECFRADLIKREPKYFEGKEEMVKPRILAIFLWVVEGMLKKNMWDLSRLKEA